MFSLLDKIVSVINQSIAIAGLSLGVSISFINVIARYIFNSSLTWASELSIFLFIWSIFFGAAYCFKKDAHICVNLLLDNVPTKVAKVMLIISHLISFVFLLAVAWYGYKYILLELHLGEMSVDLNIPMWIPYLVLPLAFISAAFRVLEKLIHIFKTPHALVLPESETEALLAAMEKDGKYSTNSEEQLEKLVKKVEAKTGGLL